jgi:hypothetical protein
MCFISSRKAFQEQVIVGLDVPILMLHESFILDHGKRRHRRFASFARVDRSSFAVRNGIFVLLAYPEEVI